MLCVFRVRCCVFLGQRFRCGVFQGVCVFVFSLHYITSLRLSAAFYQNQPQNMRGFLMTTKEFFLYICFM